MRGGGNRKRGLSARKREHVTLAQLKDTCVDPYLISNSWHPSSSGIGQLLSSSAIISLSSTIRATYRRHKCIKWYVEDGGVSLT